MDTTYYGVLRISEDATTNQMKSAYRQAVIQYHPDCIPAHVSKRMMDDAAESWLQVQEAYSVLVDPAKRKKYDDLLRQAKESERMEAEFPAPPPPPKPAPAPTKGAKQCQKCKRTVPPQSAGPLNFCTFCGWAFHGDPDKAFSEKFTWCVSSAVLGALGGLFLMFLFMLGEEHPTPTPQPPITAMKESTAKIAELVKEVTERDKKISELKKTSSSYRKSLFDQIKFTSDLGKLAGSEITDLQKTVDALPSNITMMKSGNDITFICRDSGRHVFEISKLQGDGLVHYEGGDAGVYDEQYDTHYHAVEAAKSYAIQYCPPFSVSQ